MQRSQALTPVHPQVSLCSAGTAQAEPDNGRLEVDLEVVCLQLDSFQAEGSLYTWRLAFSIHQLEVSSNNHWCLPFVCYLEGVYLQMDSFRAEDSPHTWRLAFSVHQLEVSSNSQQCYC